jgi:hypothetical protein
VEPAKKGFDVELRLPDAQWQNVFGQAGLHRNLLLARQRTQRLPTLSERIFILLPYFALFGSGVKFATRGNKCRFGKVLTSSWTMTPAI